MPTLHSSRFQSLIPVDFIAPNLKDKVFFARKLSAKDVSKIMNRLAM